MIVDLAPDVLRSFVAVAELGSFTKAATRVHLTQSTVSQQIKKLEASVGKRLLDREHGTGGTRITEHGEVLLGYARRILSISDDAISALRLPEVAKPVRLGVPEDFAGRRLIDLLTGFSRAFPGIRLDTISGWSTELRRLLDDDELDLALIKREPQEGRSIAQWKEELVWVTGGASLVEDEIIPLAVFPVGCIYRERAIRAIELGGRAWRIAYTSQGLMGVQAAVASGLGISLLPVNAILPEHRRLSSEDGFVDQPTSQIALISSGQPTGAVRTLSEYLVRYVGSMLTPA